MKKDSMAIEKAIRDAMQFGYGRQDDGRTFHSYDTCSGLVFVSVSSMIVGQPLTTMLLDPKWWQALGRARGWADKCKNPEEHLTKGHKCPWVIVWHRLVDHLAEGKDINSFFKNL
jgi:hypothetical protein